MAGLDSGAIAQLGERYTGSVEVGGSIPPGSTNLTSKGTQIYASFFVPADNRTADGVGVSRASPIDPAWLHQSNFEGDANLCVLFCACR